MEDPELKILNVITVMVSGWRERCWRPWLGTSNPSTGALWTKSTRWWLSCDGSVTLDHYLLLYVSSARDCLEYRNRISDHLEEILDMYKSIKLVWSMHRKIFRCYVSKSVNVILSFQETIITYLRSRKYPLGTNRLLSKTLGTRNQGRLNIYIQRGCQSTRRVWIPFQEDISTEKGSAISFYCIIVRSTLVGGVHPILARGGGWHGGCWQDPSLEELGDLLVGDGVAQGGDELEDIPLGVDNVEIIPGVDLHHVQVVPVNLRAVDKPDLANLLESVLQVAVHFSLIPPNIQIRLGLEPPQAGTHKVEVRPHRVMASEPESSSLKVTKVFKCLDLLDYDGGLLIFGLALSIGHKGWRDLDVEGPGKDGEEDVQDLLTWRSLGHAFTTKHECAENLVTINADSVEDKNREHNFSNFEFYVPFDLLSLKSKEPGLGLLLRLLEVHLQVGDVLLDGGEVSLSVRHGGCEFTIRWVSQCKVIASVILKMSEQNIYMEAGYENNTVLKFICRSPLRRNRKKKEGCQHLKDVCDNLTVIFSALK